MHNHALAFIIAFAIVPNVALTSASAQDSDNGTRSTRKSFLIRTPRELRPSGGGKPQFQNGSDAMLEIDLKFIAHGIEPGDDSPCWDAIRTSVGDFFAKADKTRSIHVRIYGIDGSIKASAIAKLHARIKCELAVLPTYVVLIDDERFSFGKHLSHHWEVMQNRG